MTLSLNYGVLLPMLGLEDIDDVEISIDGIRIKFMKMSVKLSQFNWTN